MLSLHYPKEWWRSEDALVLAAGGLDSIVQPSKENKKRSIRWRRNLACIGAYVVGNFWQPAYQRAEARGLCLLVEKGKKQGKMRLQDRHRYS